MRPTKYRFKTVEHDTDRKRPYIELEGTGRGVLATKLTFYTTVDRAGTRFQTEHVARFDLSLENAACVQRQIASAALEDRDLYEARQAEVMT